MQTIAMSVIGLIPLVLLLSVRDNAFVLLKHPALDQAQYGATLSSINHAIDLGIMLICVIADPGDWPGKLGRWRGCLSQTCWRRMK